jgi:hypothetical protein
VKKSCADLWGNGAPCAKGCSGKEAWIKKY